MIVKAYNINKGRNPGILSRSRSLSDYGEFIAEVRACYGKQKDLKQAVRTAVRNCIGRGILVDFLARHGSEVENMLFGEWNWDTALEVRYEEGMAEGVAIGEARGMSKVFSLLEQGVPLAQAKEMLAQRPL